MKIEQAVITAMVLSLSGCGSSPSADDDDVPHADAGGAIDGDCPTAPQPPEPPGQCESWHCSAVAPPTCWDCAMVPDHDGDACDEPSVGVCSGGECGEIPDPGATGPTGSTHASHDVVIGSDTLPTTVYLPAGDGPFPVVVFTHGFMLSPSLYQSYGEHLASWGYLVVMPQLPGSMLAPRTHRELAEILIGLLDWIDDNATVSGGPLGGVADPDHLALAGHSMGGKISLLVSTEDDRPLAVFGVDPVDAAGGPTSSDSPDYPSVTPELMASITVPLALLGETTNASGGLGQPCAPADNNFHQYYLAAVSAAVEIEVVGANHMSFLDNPNCGLTCSVCPAGSDDTATSRLLTRRYLTAFFNVFVRGQQGFHGFLAGAAIAEDVAAGLVTTANKNGF